MAAVGTSVIVVFCLCGCWSVLHVARHVLARRKPRRPGYLHGGSSRPTASTGMRAVGMRSQIGEVARLPITEDSRSMSAPGPAQRLAGFPATPPPQHPRSSSGWPTRSGYVTEDRGVSGRNRDWPAVSELWCPDGWEWVA